MDPAAMLAQLVADGNALRGAATDLDRPVPTCPGWTVRDAVLHTGEVYAHKRTIVDGDLDGPPRPWPPDWQIDDAVEWFDEQLHALVEALRARDPATTVWTWYPPDQTVGFWVRRMMQETVIHRADVESAYGPITPVDDEVAVDGIDELLLCFVALIEDDELEEPGTGQRIRIETGGRSWTVTLASNAAEVSDDADGTVDVTVTGAPSDVLLAVWNRRPYSTVTTDGDEAALQAFAAAVRVATQ